MRRDVFDIFPLAITTPFLFLHNVLEKRASWSFLRARSLFTAFNYYLSLYLTANSSNLTFVLSRLSLARKRTRSAINYDDTRVMIITAEELPFIFTSSNESAGLKKLCSRS